jgi:DNA topoisomerase-1
MSKILVIVESPGKIKKIKSILGNNYEVMASVGHIIDLKKNELSFDPETFEPNYSPMDGKGEVIKKLKKTASISKDVLLATDEDREGEMIAWSLAHVLKLKEPKRIVFNSITKNELLNAVKNPKEIDMNMVDAQKTRRVLDRLVGFKISPILWKTMRDSLSAGRVQSVVVRIIIDKENEINEFFNNKENNSSFIKFHANFNYGKNTSMNALLYTTKKNKTSKKDKENNNNDDENDDKENDNDKNEKVGDKYFIVKMENIDEAKKLLEVFMNSIFTVNNITNKPSIRNPPPPFTTSTLQQEASRKLGFPVKKTMSCAQKLYEAGFITYMRTDSTNLSDEAINNIKKYVIQTYSEENYRFRQYKDKKGNTQEAHEAVRPTDVFTDNVFTSDTINIDEKKLYNLIWRRTVASQMTPAEFNITTIEINISKAKDYLFISQIENLVNPGYLLVYNIKNMDEEEGENKEDNNGKIPKLKTKLNVENINATQEYKRPPTRYNEASLVNKLDPKNLNIGRPSTYASIIAKIQEKGYVKVQDNEGISKECITLLWDGKSDEIVENKKIIKLGQDKSKLTPTDMGKRVNTFLVANFPNIMDYKFTSNMETNLDKIAEGEIIWNDLLKNFCDKFNPVCEELLNKEINIQDDNLRILGNHPEKNHEISATIGKYGAMVRMKTGKTKYIYAPIKSPLTLEKITLEDALKLFEYPKELGKYKKNKVELCKGKYGLYIKYMDKNYSLNKDKETQEGGDKEDKEEIDEANITLEEVIKIIDEKNKDVIWQKNNMLIKEGQYGKYLMIKNKIPNKKPMFVSIPDDFDITNISDKSINELIENNKKKRYNKKNKGENKEDNKKDKVEKEENKKSEKKLVVKRNKKV